MWRFTLVVQFGTTFGLVLLRVLVTCCHVLGVTFTSVFSMVRLAVSLLHQLEAEFQGGRYSQ